ncbi:MAG: hypothetical protein QOF96_2240, partial [Actinomycetota bacterium]|nr:hypothetical protein [Actinomycetota bacterium]
MWRRCGAGACPSDRRRFPVTLPGGRRAGTAALTSSSRSGGATSPPRTRDGRAWGSEADRCHTAGRTVGRRGMPGRAASPPRSRSGTLTVGWRDAPGPLPRSWRWPRGRAAVRCRYVIAVPPVRKRLTGGAVAKDRRYRPATDPGGHRQPTVAPSGTPRRATAAGAHGSRQYTVSPPAASRGHTVTPPPGPRGRPPSGLGRDTACDPGEERAGRLLDARAARARSRLQRAGGGGVDTRGPTDAGPPRRWPATEV